MSPLPVLCSLCALTLVCFDVGVCLICRYSLLVSLYHWPLSSFGSFYSVLLEYLYPWRASSLACSY